jgi:hypothetical protein
MKREAPEKEIEMKRQLYDWMRSRNLPPVLFDKLEPQNKVLLHNIICVGNVRPTNDQLTDLYKDLGLSQTKSETKKVGYYPPNEELKEYFRPDGTPYQKKF